MQIKVIPLCLGMGIGMIAMKLICMKTDCCDSECVMQECPKDKIETSCKEKGLQKAKDKIAQIVSDIEKLEMSDIKAKTKETLGQIKEKILSIHL